MNQHLNTGVVTTTETSCISTMLLAVRSVQHNYSTRIIRQACKTLQNGKGHIDPQKNSCWTQG